MPTPDQLVAGAAAPIAVAAAAAIRTHDAAAFEKAMREALTRYHTAAYLRGIADRTGIMPRGLSRAERTDLKAMLQEQFTHLADFGASLSEMSDAQIAARAALWPGGVRATFWMGRTNNALPIYPGACSQCFGRCRCDVSEKDGEWYWNATNDEATCGDCRERGVTWQPYTG